MPSNTLFVDFKVGDKSAFAAADALPAKLAQSGDAAGKAYATAFERQLASVQSRAGASVQDRQIFRNIQLAATQSEAEIYKIQAASAFENSKNKLAIFRAEKAAEIAGETETAGKVKQIRGFGAVFRAAGLHSIGITESELNAGIALYNNYIEKQAIAAKAATTTAEAAAASQSSIAAIGTSLGGLGIAGALVTIAAGAAIVYHITRDIRDAEAQKLKFIEQGAIASNKAILAKQAEAKALSDSVAAQEHQFKLAKQLEDADAGRLKSLLVIAELNGRSEDVLKIRAALLQQPGKDQAKIDADYEARTSNAVKRAKAEADFEREQQQKRIEKAKELAKTTTDFFQTLNERRNADNPFFKILNDAQALEKQILKLDPALQALARTQASILTANALFGARADNALGVSDLRQQASFFRNGQKAETSDDLLRRLGFNPTQFKNLSDAQKANFATQFGSQQAVALGRASSGGSLGGVNIADLAIGAFNNAKQRQSTEETVQQRLDRQFKELDKLNPANDEQRLILERKIQSASQGVDPTTLRQDTRNRVSDALNDIADKQARSQLEAMQAVDRNTEALNKLTAIYDGIGKNGGTVGGSVNITIDDNSNGRATTDVKAPTPNDTAAGFASGN